MNLVLAVLLAMQVDVLEVVSRDGHRYHTTRALAHEFARDFAQAERPANWVRAVDPACAEHHVGKVPSEGGSGRVNRTRVDGRAATTCDSSTGSSLDPNTQAMIEYTPIWGVPRHTMQPFYDDLKFSWKGLPAFNTFRQLVAGCKTIKNFLVHLTPDIDLTRQPALPTCLDGLAWMDLPGWTRSWYVVVSGCVC